MDKYTMRNYIEKNFDRIVEDHFEVLEDAYDYCDDSLDFSINNIDALQFYKAWKESPGFKVTVFLEEIEGDDEDSKGTEL